LDRLADVKARIAQAAKDAERDRASVTLVAVTKTFTAADILPVLEAGHRVFGENRVQEAKGKWPELKARFPDIELHLIGPLQTNKVKDAVALFDVIESVDRPKLAAALAAEMKRTGRRLPCFIQVNTGAEPQKAGVLPKETAAFVANCRQEGLDVAGLMCLPPVDDEAVLHFALLRKLAKEIGLNGLSMGMSGDYPAAIRLGATYVRIGSAIFGTRG
jgi:hypothetical protein